MPRVIHFEIGVDNPDRAVKFYQDVFGWKIKNWGGPMNYWLATTGKSPEPGIDGALMERWPSKEGTINTIGVSDLEASIKKVTEAGGKVIQEKQTIPGIGYFCYAKDVEGNTFGMMQSDPKAK